jgi:hypothetical protein
MPTANSTAIHEVNRLVVVIASPESGKSSKCSGEKISKYPDEMLPNSVLLFKFETIEMAPRW